MPSSKQIGRGDTNISSLGPPPILAHLGLTFEESPALLILDGRAKIVYREQKAHAKQFLSYRLKKARKKCALMHLNGRIQVRLTQTNNV